MTYYKFKCSHWLNKFYINECTQIITSCVIYNPAYTYKFQLKTTKIPFISNLKKPGCASKQDMLELATLPY